MPYDANKSRDLLRIAQAYAQHPTGEYIGQMATQLVDAEGEIKALANLNADLRNASDESGRRLVAESQAHRTTKEKLSDEIRILQEQKSALVAALEAISADSRGAKKIAQDALAKLNPAPAAPAT